MRLFTVFPLMIIPVIIYNVLALGGTAFSTVEALRERLDTDESCVFDDFIYCMYC